MLLKWLSDPVPHGAGPTLLLAMQVPMKSVQKPLHKGHFIFSNMKP